MKAFTLIFFSILSLAACSTERLPDTQQMEQDSAQKIMDTVPDMRLDTVAVN